MPQLLYFSHHVQLARAVEGGVGSRDNTLIHFKMGPSDTVEGKSSLSDSLHVSLVPPPAFPTSFLSERYWLW